MAEIPTKETVAMARASFDRCRAVADFIPSFYRIFFEKCPEAEPMFAHTNFERQHKLLQHAFGLLLLYPARMETEPWLLKRVANRHSAADLNVDPSLYPVFLDSWIAAVREHDPECTNEVEAAWREAVAPGVAYMQSRYDKGSGE